MKIGDRFEVGIKDDGQYFDVAEGIIEDIDDGVATIVIPATRIQVQVKQTADFRAEPRHDGPDRILAGESEGSFVEVPPQTTVPRGSLQAEGSIGDGIHNKELDSSALD